MDCKHPTRCRSCEHFDRGACALEAGLDAALAVLEAKPRAAGAPVALLWREPIAA